MSLLVRVAGAASRRLGRPELLALASPQAGEEQREEIGIAAVLASTLREAGTYVDVGTNRGQLLGKAVHIAPAGRHVAFEPIPALAEIVRRSYPSVDCRQKALGARPETARFCYFRGLDGWSGLRRNPQIDEARGRPEYIEVEVSTLDEELADVTPAVLKIDVEGAEQAVLEGGLRTLERTRPVVIFEHVPAAAALYGAAPGAPWVLFEQLGYVVFTAAGEGPVAQREVAAASRVVNWVARPRQ